MGKKKIKLIPGYNPDKYRDELCEQGNKIRATMTSEEYINYINEKAKELDELIKSGNLESFYKSE
ncbi:MAG: hypothetical protein FWG98_08205 [Candidatus Cloacimonetes bacterium]|nr:hypothetical protein [Candidatus Cloacimonadota bacterium]